MGHLSLLVTHTLRDGSVRSHAKRPRASGFVQTPQWWAKGSNVLFSARIRRRFSVSEEHICDPLSLRPTVDRPSPQRNAAEARSLA